MVDFAKLKNRRFTPEELSKAFDNINTPFANKDDRFWYPATDKSGNGTALIRFLPPSPMDNSENVQKIPVVKIFKHWFKNQDTNRSLSENCPTTIGLPCPICEYNSSIWKTSEKQARNQKRKIHYLSNIYILEDPANPENEGKVKIYLYGVKLYEMVNLAMKPAFADQTPIDPFDPWNGANFRLRIRTVDGQRNYDKSDFLSQSQLFKDDSDFEKVWNQQHSLEAFIAPSEFKSYDYLQEKLDYVLKKEGNKSYGTQSSDDDDVFEQKESPTKKSSDDSEDDSWDDWTTDND